MNALESFALGFALCLVVWLVWDTRRDRRNLRRAQATAETEYEQRAEAREAGVGERVYPPARLWRKDSGLG